MARRWILTAVLATVLVVAGVFVAREIRDDDSGAATSATPTSDATSTTATTTTAPAATTTTLAPTTTVAPTTTTGPPGPCGTDTGPIRVAVDTAVAGAAQDADIASCRLAASDPSWAAVALTAKPGAQFAAVTAIVHGGAGSWSVVAQGGTSAGCGQVPQQVLVDLGQFCTGTGGGGAR